MVSAVVGHCPVDRLVLVENCIRPSHAETDGANGQHRCCSPGDIGAWRRPDRRPGCAAGARARSGRPRPGRGCALSTARLAGVATTGLPMRDLGERVGKEPTEFPAQGTGLGEIGPPSPRRGRLVPALMVAVTCGTHRARPPGRQACTAGRSTPTTVLSLEWASARRVQRELVPHIIHPLRSRQHA